MLRLFPVGPVMITILTLLTFLRGRSELQSKLNHFGKYRKEEKIQSCLTEVIEVKQETRDFEPRVLQFDNIKGLLERFRFYTYS